jgi:hypothetical protein
LKNWIPDQVWNDEIDEISFWTNLKFAHFLLGVLGALGGKNPLYSLHTLLSKISPTLRIK